MRSSEFPGGDQGCTNKRIQQQFVGCAARQCSEALEHGGIVSPPAAPGLCIEHNPAANRRAGRRRAQDEVITGDDHGRPLQAQLQPSRRPGLNCVCAEHARPRRDLAGPSEEINRCVVLERSVRIRQQAHLRVEQQCGLQGARQGDNITAMHLVCIHTTQVDCQAAARAAAGHGLLVRLQAAHARREPLRQQLYGVAHGQRAIEQRPGYDCAEAAEREGAVHPQARACAVAPCGQMRQLRRHLTAQFLQTKPGSCTHAHNRRACKARPLDQFGHVKLHKVEP